MPKFFIENNQVNNNEIIIESEDVNHITNVLRKRIGDSLHVCDKDTSKNYIVTIKQIKKDNILCDIDEELGSRAEPNINIALFQGLPKSDKMELIIEKGTEIGLSNVYPVEMERSIVKLKEKEKKVQRWQKIAEVAAKQSKRDIVPKVNDVINFKNIELYVKEYDILLVAYEDEEDLNIKNVLKQLSEKQLGNDKKLDIAVLIGPEGGIAPEEIDILKKFANTKVISLGKRILRTETAGIVVMSQLIYEFEF